MGKHKVKNAVNYIGAFEQTLADEARRREVDGIICGHIHHAVIHDKFGIRYMNCGDSVESCSALVGHADGRSRSSPGSTPASKSRLRPRLIDQDEEAEIAA